MTGLVVSELWELAVSGSSDGTLSACQLKGGIKVWSTLVFSSMDGISTMVGGEDIWTVFVGGEDGTVAAYNAKDGTQRWRTAGQQFDVLSMRVILPQGVPGFLAKYVFSFMLTEDSQGTLTAQDTKVGACPCWPPWAWW